MSGANTKQEFPILIYFSFRGRAQAIRNLICYLKIDYYEFFVDEPGHNTKTIPQNVLQKMKKLKVEKQQLPALAHNDILVYNQEAIMIYLCKFYKHEQLLGTDIYMKARFNELIFTYLPQARSLSKVYELAISSLNKSQQQIDEQAHKLLTALFRQAKYLTYYCEYLSRQQKPQFILGELTVVDFIFMESTEYLLGLFGKPQRINAGNSYGLIQNEKESDSRSLIHYMQILRDYRKWMNKQPFYIENNQYLQSFSIKNSWMSEEKTEGFRKIWVGNPKLVL